MLSDTLIRWLGKKPVNEQQEYRNLLANRPSIFAQYNEKKGQIDQINSRISELSSMNLNLTAERAKLLKSYSDLMIQMKLAKEAEEKIFLEQERIKIEEKKRLQEAEILRLELEKRRFDEERRLFEEAKQKEQALKVTSTPVIDSPASIVSPPVAPVETKKSNAGMILSVAALGVGAYFFTKE